MRRRDLARWVLAMLVLSALDAVAAGVLTAVEALSLLSFALGRALAWVAA